MDFQKVPNTEKSVPWSRPAPVEVFTDVTYVDTGNNDIPDGTFNTSNPIGS